MEKREFSLENFISHAHKVVDEVASLEETHQHYVCEDPKHDVLLLLQQNFCWSLVEVHLHSKAMDNWITKIKTEYPQVKFCAFSSDNSPTQYRLVTAFKYYKDLCDKHNMPLLVTFMAENHGKGQWDGAGAFFAKVYLKRGVAFLRSKNRDISQFARWFNQQHGKPKYCRKKKVEGTHMKRSQKHYNIPSVPFLNRRMGSKDNLKPFHNICSFGFLRSLQVRWGMMGVLIEKNSVDIPKKTSKKSSVTVKAKVYRFRRSKRGNASSLIIRTCTIQRLSYS